MRKFSLARGQQVLLGLLGAAAFDGGDLRALQCIDVFGGVGITDQSAGKRFTIVECA